MSNKIIFAKAKKDDLDQIIVLLQEDELGRSREEISNLTPYLQAFELISKDSNQMLMVGRLKGEIVSTCHLSIMPSLTFTGRTRLNIEAVRVLSNHRSQGIGEEMLQEAINFGKENGATIIQLSTNKQRTQAFEFYKKLGFEDTHIGMKLYL